MTDHPTPQPVGWRDVHALVKESRDEILASVDKGFSETTAVLTGHSVRITALEQQNVIEAAAKAARELLAMELATAADSRTKRIDRFLSGGRGVFLLLMALFSTIITAWRSVVG